jgi:hypothetical protein
MSLQMKIQLMYRLQIRNCTYIYIDEVDFITTSDLDAWSMFHRESYGIENEV